MKWEIAWSETALKDATRLDRQVRERILAALDRLAETGEGDIRKLTDRGSEMRLRVGDWRVRFRFLHGTGFIEVIRVLHRSRAYKE